MRTPKCRFLLLLVLCFIPAMALAQRYTVTDLGPLAPTGINSWAQVVGNYNGHAFIWARGQGMRDLGLLPGGTFSRAAGINDLGAVTGTGDGTGSVSLYGVTVPCDNLIQPFIWTQRKGMRLPPPISWDSIELAPCSVPFHASGINALSQVVGYTGGYHDYQWGTLWTSTEGLSLFGGSYPPTYANAINNAGQIVGQNSTQSLYFVGHATSWKSDITMDLGTLGGDADVRDYSSAANGVNDRGQIVGWSTTTPISWGVWATYQLHAVLWDQSGAIVDLSTLPGDSFSIASKINFFGLIVGSSGNSLAWSDDPMGPIFQVSGRPFIWTERNGMRDLNTLIPANSGWVLQSATDINVWGQIVGSGTRNGQPRGYLLTPGNPFQVF